MSTLSRSHSFSRFCTCVLLFHLLVLCQCAGHLPFHTPVTEPSWVKGNSRVQSCVFAVLLRVLCVHPLVSNLRFITLVLRVWLLLCESDLENNLLLNNRKRFHLQTHCFRFAGVRSLTRVRCIDEGRWLAIQITHDLSLFVCVSILNITKKQPN